MTTEELQQSVRSKLEAAIRAQRESWDAAQRGHHGLHWRYLCLCR